MGYTKIFTTKTLTRFLIEEQRRYQPCDRRLHRAGQ